MHSASFFRLKQLLRRAAAGEELTVGFLGGSITQGSLSSTPETCYAFRVYRWFVRTFPQAAFHYVNAGIGGTDSLYGVSRAVSDLLMYQPDFVVVDFSVNDIDLPFRKETYEGILRRVLSWPSAPAVVLLCNIYYDTGLTAEDDHVEIGEHYGVPHVSIRDSIYKDLHAGRYARRELLSPDGLHPNDFGHELVAGEITKLLDAVNARRDEPEAVPPFPAPQTVNAYENARRLTIRDVSPRLQGFRADPAPKRPGTWTPGKTAGSVRTPGMRSPSRWKPPASRCSTAKPSAGQPSLPGWCWTVTQRTPFFWTPTLQRIGATVSICSPSFTTASKSSTPWS